MQRWRKGGGRGVGGTRAPASAGLAVPQCPEKLSEHLLLILDLAIQHPSAATHRAEVRISLSVSTRCCSAAGERRDSKQLSASSSLPAYLLRNARRKDLLARVPCLDVEPGAPSAHTTYHAAAVKALLTTSLLPTTDTAAAAAADRSGGLSLRTLAAWTGPSSAALPPAGFPRPPPGAAPAAAAWTASAGVPQRATGLRSARRAAPPPAGCVYGGGPFLSCEYIPYT
jgi:hypothetical protein